VLEREMLQTDRQTIGVEDIESLTLYAIYDYFLENPAVSEIK
jgi:hypothetical protein